jgi:hypothetical protein
MYFALPSASVLSIIKKKMNKIIGKVHFDLKNQNKIKIKVRNCGNTFRLSINYLYPKKEYKNRIQL